MIHIAIQTAIKDESVSVFQDEDLLEDVYVKERFSDEALDVFEESTQMAGIDLKDIEFITVVIGPGSFTGLKSGLAFAKGIAYPKDLPIVSITSLRGLLESAKHKLADSKIIVPLLDARNERAYYQVFKMKNSDFVEDSNVEVGNVEEILRSNEEALFIGSGVDNNLPLFQKANYIKDVRIEPKAVGVLGLKFFNEGKVSKLREVSPLYISDPKITISSKK